MKNQVVVHVQWNVGLKTDKYLKQDGGYPHSKDPNNKKMYRRNPNLIDDFKLQFQ